MAILNTDTPNVTVHYLTKFQADSYNSQKVRVGEVVRTDRRKTDDRPDPMAEDKTSRVDGGRG